jgi:hypothetical protein
MCCGKTVERLTPQMCNIVMCGATILPGVCESVRTCFVNVPLTLKACGYGPKKRKWRRKDAYTSMLLVVRSPEGVECTHEDVPL